MDRPVTAAAGDGPHQLINPAMLSRPSGFSHVVVPATGRTVYLGGQTAHGADGSLPGEGIVEQYDAAAANVVRALGAAGARPHHLVSLLIFTSAGDEYRANLRAIGRAHRRHLGRRYPAAAFFEVAGLFDPQSKVELVGIAVVPEGRQR
jgi:enamine deaminase RidA (YjgF/YER057c/UK114 family)